MRKLLAWINAIPHLFGKLIVWICIVGGSGSIIWSFRIVSRTDNDPAAVLGLALGFFGGELLTMARRSASKNETNKDKHKEEEL